MFLPLAGAKDDSERLRFIRRLLVPFEPVQIKLHLAFVTGFEFAEFQVNRNEAAQFAMVKQKIERVVLAVNGHAFLPRYKTKTSAQFQDERFHLAQDGGFNVLFAVRVLKTEEIQHVRIAEDQVWREFVLF